MSILQEYEQINGRLVEEFGPNILKISVERVSLRDDEALYSSSW